MSTIASLVIKLSADSSEMHKALGNVRRDVEKNVGRAGMDFSEGIVAGLGGIGLALAGVGAMSVKSAADMGMTKVAFTQMLGSAEKATAFVKDLQKFAAETPFEFEQVKGAAQKFLAFGFTAEQVIPVLTSVGNAAAGLGMGQDGIDRLTLALGQMAAKGKVSGEEMRQLAEAGIPAWQMLADKMGVSVPEAMEKVSKSGVSAAVGLDAIVGGMDKKFAGMMEKQAQEIPGLFATLTDNMGMAAIELGNTLSEGLNIKGLLKSVGDGFTEFTTVLQSSGLAEALRTFIPPEVEFAIYGIATALTIAAIPAVVNFGLALSVNAVAGVRSFLGGISLLGQGITMTAGFIRVAGAQIQLFSILCQGSATGLTGFSAALKMVETGFRSLTASMGPVGLAVAAISLAVTLFVVSGGDLSGVLKAVGLDSALLLNSFNHLKKSCVMLWDAFVGLLGVAIDILTPFIYLGVFMSGVFVYALTYAVKIIVLMTDMFLWLASVLIGEVVRSFWQCMDAVTSFGSYLDGLTGGALSSIIGKVKEAVAWFLNLISVMNQAAAQKNSDQAGVGDFKRGEDTNTKPPVETTKTKTDFSNFGGGGGDGGKGKKGDKGPDLAKEALSTSKSIEEKWYELFSTRSGMIDRWHKEELATLDKSKSANANYSRDVQRLDEIAQEKKRAALLETEKQQRDSLDRVKELLQGSERTSNLSSMSGGQKMSAEMDYSYLDQIESVKKKYQGISDDYQRMTKEDQETFVQSLEARGIAYELNGKGELLFTQQQHREELGLYTNLLKEKNLALIQNKALQADIEEAFSQNSLARLQEVLTAEAAMKLNNYEADQEMMALYQEATLAAHATTAQLISGMYSTAFGGLSNGISDILTGTKNASEAFEELGKNMIKTVADFVAKKIAGMVMLQVFGATQQKKEVAVAATAGAAVAASWAKAAAMVSLATMGGNSVGAIAGMTAAIGSAMTMAAVPMLASGGITTGPAAAIIGEGRFDETVLPLNSRIIAPHFAEALSLLGATDSDNMGNSGSQTTATVQIYGDIGKESTVDEVQDAMMWALRDARGG